MVRLYNPIAKNVREVRKNSVPSMSKIAVAGYCPLSSQHSGSTATEAGFNIQESNWVGRNYMGGGPVQGIQLLMFRDPEYKFARSHLQWG